MLKIKLALFPCKVQQTSKTKKRLVMLRITTHLTAHLRHITWSDATMDDLLLWTHGCQH